MGSSKSSASEHRPNSYDPQFCACGLVLGHIITEDKVDPGEKTNGWWTTLKPGDPLDPVEFQKLINGYYEEMRANAIFTKEKEDEEKMKTAFWTIAALCLLGTWIVGTILAVIYFIVWMVS